MRPLVRLARTVYRALMRLAPKATRSAYGRQMRDTFDIMSADAARRGPLALARLLSREVWDLARSRQHEPPSIPSSRRGWMPTGSAWRSLLRRPGYAMAVVATLGFGTAITTTIFTVADTVLFRPLPYPNGDRLVTVMEASPEAPGQPSLVAPVRLQDWQRLTTAFDAISGSYAENVTDTSPQHPERLSGRRVTPGFFEVFGAPPLAGRTFVKEEEMFGGPAAVIISERFWVRRFSRDPDALAASLTIGDVAYPIVGIMPRDFSPAAIDVWLPAQVAPALLQARGARFMTGIGRLKAGVLADQGRADLDRVQTTLGAMYPDTDRGWTTVVGDLKESRVGASRTSLAMMMGAALMVWLVAMSNVASLVVVHVQQRARELSIRTALGSSRTQLVLMVGREVMGLSLAGGVLGLGLATVLIAAVPATFDSLPGLTDISLNSRALAFALGTSMLAAVLCGVMPALGLTRSGRAADVTRAGRGAVRTTPRTQRVLVAAQVALGVVLCASASLLASSYHALTQVDRGFTTDGVLTFHVGARWDEDRARIGALQVAIIDALHTVPGVSAAGLANFLPAPGGSLRYQVKVDGLTGPDPGGLFTVGSRMMGANYFAAVGATLIEGTACSDFRLGDSRQPAAVLNQQFARRYANGQSLIGRQLQIAGGSTGTFTIVGIVADLAEDGVDVDRFPFVYTCTTPGGWPDPNYVVRTGDVPALLARLPSLVRERDASRAVFDVTPLEDVVSGAIDGPRQHAGLTGTFAASALLLAALGLYALFARHVADSRREIGVRLALGATPGHVTGLVLRHAGVLLGSGFVTGTLLSVGAFLLLRSSLHGAGTANAVALAAAGLTLLMACSLAIVAPAIRAGRVPPTEALAGE